MILNSKNTKQCNELAFSMDEPRLLATGFDKYRSDYGLLIWDVEKARLSSINEDKDNSGGAVPEVPPSRSHSNMNFNRVDREFFRTGVEPLGILKLNN